MRQPLVDVGPDPGAPEQRLVRIELLAAISVVVPTYREAENIPYVIERLDKLRRTEDVDLELIFVDDDSRDGSVEAVRACGHDWVSDHRSHREPWIESRSD